MIRIIFWIVIGILLLIQLLAYIIWRIALYSPKKGQGEDHRLQDNDRMRPYAERVHKRIDEWNAVPFESVTIAARDKKRLSARYYHIADDAPLVICCHGYRGTPSRDFSIGSRIFQARGCNLLHIEQRAHLGSEGHCIGMGVAERYDILAWIDWAQARFGQELRIVLCGISMGAASVLMVSGMQPPAAVKGVIADAPYTSPKDILTGVIRAMRLPVPIVYPLLTYGAWLFGGVRLNDPTADARKMVQKSQLPILLIHGEADDFVPCAMSKEIANANPEKIELHTFPNAGHGLSALTDEPRYAQIVNTYLDRVGC